jgi:lipopolysaccharide transport system permease protein
MEEVIVPLTVPSRPTIVIRAPSFSPLAVGNAVKRLVHCRDLLYTLSVHRLKVRYKQSLLGPVWAILQPLSLMLIYTIIFSRIFRIPTNGAPYALFAYTALVPWTYFATGLSTGTNSLVTHSSLITKVYFPREILPLTYVVAALVDLLVATVVLSPLMAYYDVHLTVRAIYAIPVIGILTVFIVGVSLVLSAIQVRYRDIGVALPLVLQVWMFATPVIYPLSIVPVKWRSLYLLNPMAGIVESFRRVVLLGAQPELQALATSAVISAILLPAAFVYFKHVEATLADVV